MKNWLRRLRGAAGLGVAWAAAWVPFGVLLGFVLWLILEPSAGLRPVIEINALTFGVLGFVGGTLFSVVLGWTEGGRRFRDLKLSRFAALGGLGGLLPGGLAVMSGLWGAEATSWIGMTVLAASTLLASGSAAGSLWLAGGANDENRLKAGREGPAVPPLKRDQLDPVAAERTG